MPCADMEVSNAGQSSEAQQYQCVNHSHNKKKDLCNPFCNCNRCGAQILSYFPVINYNFTLISTVIKTKEPVYKPVFVSYFFGSIWQPPQIV